jgi:CRP-like cAMP-binding protein
LGIEDDIHFLERVPTLRLLGREALRILAIGAESRNVHKGEVLFVAGEVADCGYVIQEGSFRLETRSRLAADVMVEAGTLLGELALIAETKRPATAMASEPSSVIRISRTLFLKMLEGYPEAAGIMREQIVRRAQQTVKDMTDVRALLDTSQQPGQ